MADPLERYLPKERILSRSVLDRLLDDDPAASHDRPSTVGGQVRDIREAIRRDLEALLNTRRCPETPPSELRELKDALVSYGLDNVVSSNLVTDESKLRLARAIERRIALFETRLSDVEVTILKNRVQGERALRMRIHASFRVDEGMPPINFESKIDAATQRFLIEAEND
jgi:type VI secretion system protein ImpF